MSSIVLGIETSCDETAAAVLRGTAGSPPEILAEVTLSQIADHRPYGGVVPEIAARAHLAQLDRVIGRAMAQSGLSFGALDAIAATAGPGLIGGVIVGLTTAKALALAANVKLIGINHLEGHALSVRLSHAVAFPYLLLLVSGGHCQILLVEGVGRYRQLGTTIDDAAGEAFDKAAKLLGLGYPGGPEIERAARRGNPRAFVLPRPMIGRAGFDFSFSGLKTALRQTIEGLEPISEQQRDDLAASFQEAVAACLADRARAAIAAMPEITTLVVAGGVAANQRVREVLEELRGVTLVVPPVKWCTDNAAMIALAGIERLALGLEDRFDLPARPRWPLDPAARRIAHNRSELR